MPLHETQHMFFGLRSLDLRPAVTGVMHGWPWANAHLHVSSPRTTLEEC